MSPILPREGNEPICVCGKQMRKVSGKYGTFYGCPDYPRCQHTEKTDDDFDDKIHEE